MFKIKKENTKVEIELAIDGKEWEEGVEKVYEANKSKFNIVGFRKGHAPRKVIEKQYGDSVFFDDAIQYFLDKTLNEVVAKNPELDPVTMPTSQFESFTPEAGLKMKLNYEIVPDFKLCEYKGAEIELPKVEVKDKEVDHYIHHLLEDNAKFEVVEREVKTGDSVVIDFTGYIDGKAFDGGAGEDYPLEIGSHTFIDTFEDQLIGHKKGDEVDVNVTFPENYGAAEFQNKKALFKVTVKEVREKVLPTLDDKFVADTTEFETVEEYRKNTVAHIQNMKEKDLEKKFRQKFDEFMLNNTEIQIPSQMLEENCQQDMARFTQMLSMYGMTLESYLQQTGAKEDEFKKASREKTLNSIKLRYIYRKLLEENKITVSREEVLKAANGAKDEHSLMHAENDLLLDKLFKQMKEIVKIKYINE